MIFALHTGTDSSTIVVTANNYVRHLEHANGILKARHEIEIGIHDHVGHVAKDKDTARIFSHDFVGWDSGVGASLNVLSETVGG
jgi:hypothetical protein